MKYQEFIMKDLLNKIETLEYEVCSLRYQVSHLKEQQSRDEAVKFYGRTKMSN